MTLKNMVYYLRREDRCWSSLRILGAWHDPRRVGIGHCGAGHADLDAAHESRASRAIPTARSPFPALAPAARRNTRLIGIVFFDGPRRARKPQGLHQFARAGAFFEGGFRKKEAVGVRLFDLRQAYQGETNLRQRFVAGVPNVARAANFFGDTSGKRFAIGSRQQRKEARLFAIESETARRLTFLFKFREQSAAPSTRPAWENVISR